MGQALAKLDVRENSTRKYLELIVRNKENTIRKSNHNNNDDYYIDIIKRKSNALREYLGKTKEKVNEPMENSNGKTKSKYIGVDEAAEYTNKTTKTIRNWIKAGMPHTTVNGKHFISIETLEVWKVRKYEKIKFVPESANGKDSEPVDNSVSAEITYTEIYQPKNNSPQNHQPVQIIDVGRNYMAEVEEKISSALSEQREFFTAALVSIEKKQELERQENKVVIDTLANENAQLVKKVEHLVSRVQRTEEFIECQEKKLPWWNFGGRMLSLKRL